MAHCVNVLHGKQADVCAHLNNNSCHVHTNQPALANMSLQT